MLASQKFTERYSSDEQSLQHKNLVALSKGKEGTYGDSTKEVSRDADLRYGSPKTSKQVPETRRFGIPQKTQDQNK